MAATTQSTFIIFLEFKYHLGARNKRAKEFTVQNTATNEQFDVRNAIFDKPYWGRTDYAEVLRHPIGADAEIREWIEQRAYYTSKYKYMWQKLDEAEQVISISPSFIIG